MSDQTPSTEILEIQVGGMDCAGCVSTVEKALLALPGVSEAKVSLAEAKAVVRIDKSQVTVAALHEAVEDAGYEVAR